MAIRNPISDARELRQNQTESEALLWKLLRAKQLCGLKFRRQHPEPPFILDFACTKEHFAVEIDGGYHDDQFVKDQGREQYLIERGWRIIRFTNNDVRNDVEAVAVAIARHLGLEYEFNKRRGGLTNLTDRDRISRDKEARLTSRKTNA